VTAKTKILLDKKPIEFKDLKVGQVVYAIGKIHKKVFIAFCIMVKSGVGGAGKIYDKIASIDPKVKQVVVGKVMVQVTAKTKIMKGKTPITFGDLKVGMMVYVEGKYNGKILEAILIVVK